MSVLSCNRKQCENVMCDKHSYRYGYICDPCFDELVNSGPQSDIEEFMYSSAVLSSDKNQALARYSAEFTENEE